MRVVADHARATTFLIADGVVPSNEWRGYVLRKIMRRAMRHGRKLGMHEPFLHSLVDVLVREMGDAYPELKAGRDAIAQVIKTEEERFDAVLTGGLPRLEEVLERAAKGNKTVPGDEAFKLYDTYGLPRDFIEDLASNQGLKFDAEGFDAAMEGQREKARAGSSFDGKKDEFAFASDQERESLQQAGDVFEGYTETLPEGRVGAGAVRRQEEAGRRARAKARRVTRCSRRRRSTSKPADRSRIRAGSRPRTAAARASPAWCGSAGTAARASAREHRADDRRARHRHRAKSTRRVATRRGAITRPRICCTPRCARCSAATSSRPARSSRPIGCASTSSTSPPSPAERAHEIERIVNEAILENAPVKTDGEEHAGGDRRRRDGAVRREVRRQGARRRDRRRRVQHRAVRRHARARDRRHRRVSDHRRIRRRGRRPPHRGASPASAPTSSARKSIDEIDERRASWRRPGTAAGVDRSAEQDRRASCRRKSSSSRRSSRWAAVAAARRRRRRRSRSADRR